ncbi:hypothetical protein [Mycobacterium uberis]|uniref:hypothetical protein n=1 Tax=Mycobacterium uberis TaxID=2162698 RepID=UPI000E305694
MWSLFYWLLVFLVGSGSVAAVANLMMAAMIAPIAILGTATAVLCDLWSAGAQLLIRFTGPELWCVLSAVH